MPLAIKDVSKICFPFRHHAIHHPEIATRWIRSFTIGVFPAGVDISTAYSDFGEKKRIPAVSRCN
jgi:hypothetical protein